MMIGSGVGTAPGAPDLPRYGLGIVAAAVLLIGELLAALTRWAFLTHRIRARLDSGHWSKLLGVRTLALGIWMGLAYGFDMDMMK